MACGHTVCVACCDGVWGHPCVMYTPSRRVDVDPASGAPPLCTPKPLVQVTWTQFEKNLVEDLVPFGCPADSYNEVASLFSRTPTRRSSSCSTFASGVFNQDVQTFSSLAIATFYVPYFLCACLTYGIASPRAYSYLHCWVELLLVDSSGTSSTD